MFYVLAYKDGKVNRGMVAHTFEMRPTAINFTGGQGFESWSLGDYSRVRVTIDNKMIAEIVRKETRSAFIPDPPAPQPEVSFKKG